MRNLKKIIAGLAACALAIASLSTAAFADASNYTYTYDYWEQEQASPDAYAPALQIFGKDLGIGDFKEPQGVYVRDNHLYICDTGNHRIVELVQENGKYVLERVIDSVTIDGEASPLSRPYDVFVTEEYELVIADYGNKRILHTDKNLQSIKVIGRPEDDTYTLNNFLPMKLVLDNANRIYAQVENINKGLLEFDANGEFTGYVGASPVTFDWVDYIWRFFMTEEQIAQQEQFVPTEYNNVALDSEGFLYVTLDTYKDADYRSSQPVRRLNSMGTDILTRNGNTEPCGDLQWGGAGGISGASRFIDVVTFENDSYFCLDRVRGRIFAYDFQGNLLYAFGGRGNRAGYFQSPVAIDRMGDTLFVVDSMYASVTVFEITEYGALINDALAEYRAGHYDVSAEKWTEVLRLNGNYDQAYIGIGRALLRQGDYEGAMKYFSEKRDAENYSKAFELYRKELVEKYISYIVVIIIILIVAPWLIKTILKIRKEVRECE